MRDLSGIPEEEHAHGQTIKALRVVLRLMFARGQIVVGTTSVQVASQRQSDDWAASLACPASPLSAAPCTLCHDTSHAAHVIASVLLRHTYPWRHLRAEAEHYLVWSATSSRGGSALNGRMIDSTTLCLYGVLVWLSGASTNTCTRPLGLHGIQGVVCWKAEWLGTSHTRECAMMQMWVHLQHVQ